MSFGDDLSGTPEEEGGSALVHFSYTERGNIVSMLRVAKGVFVDIGVDEDGQPKIEVKPSLGYRVQKVNGMVLATDSEGRLVL